MIRVMKAGRYRKSYTEGITKGEAMATVKTAISIDKKLFKKVEQLAKDLRLSRSQVFAQAVEYMIEHDGNLDLIRRINKAWADGLDEDEKQMMEEIRSRRARWFKDNPW